MRLDKRVVGEVGISAAHPVDLLGLARREGLVRVQAPDASQQPLAPEDFVDAGNAAREAVLGIEEGGVRIYVRRGGDNIPGGAPWLS